MFASRHGAAFPPLDGMIRLVLLFAASAGLAILTLMQPQGQAQGFPWLATAVACGLLLGQGQQAHGPGTAAFFAALVVAGIASGHLPGDSVLLALPSTAELACAIWLARRYLGTGPVRKLATPVGPIVAFSAAAALSALLHGLLEQASAVASLRYFASHLAALTILAPLVMAASAPHRTGAGIKGVLGWIIAGAAIAAFALAWRIGFLLLEQGRPETRFATLQMFLAVQTLIALPVAMMFARGRHMNRLLRNSRDEIRRVVDNLDEVVFRINPQGCWVSLNTAWESITGRSVKQTVGTRFVDFLDSEDRAGAIENLNRLMAGEIDLLDVSRTITGLDGSRRHVIVRARCAFDADGAPIGAVGHMRDITDWHADREAREKSESQFNTLAGNAPAGIWHTDAQGRYTYVSPGWLHLAGLAEDEWQGTAWVEAIHPDHRAEVLRNWEAAHVSKERLYGEWRWLHPDGSEVWVTTAGAPQLDADDNLVGFVGINIDVTDRRAAQSRLAQRENQLQIIADNIDDALFMIDTEGQCSYASLFAGEILAARPDQLVGQRFSDMFGTEHSQYIERCFASLYRGAADGCDLHIRLVGEEQRVRWLEGQIALVRDEATGRPCTFIASLRDVSEAKRLHEELTAAREKAEHAAEAKSNFLANMSHEIRTPMNGVLGFTELLLASDLDAAQERQARMIAESGRAMMRLLNDILDVSKIEAGKMQIQPASVDIRHKIRTCVRLLEPVANDKGITLVYTTAESLPKRLISDPLRLRQILLNLIGNAVKFTEKGRVSITADVERAGENEILVLTVADTGIGIAPAKLRTIFNQFSQADGSIGRRYGGTGLGLSISSQLAEMMGGSIGVESAEGEGTRFTVKLPLQRAPEEVTDRPESAAALKKIGIREAEQRSCTRVLVAEDHDINQELVLAMARRIGLEPDLACNGLEALRLVKQSQDEGRPYALVLMDVQMPEMDGLQATRRLREAGFDAETLPIVALTANCYPEDIEACRAAGMQGHLAKPLNMEALRKAVMIHVDGPESDEAAPPAAALPLLGGGLADRYAARKRTLFEIMHRAAEDAGAEYWEELIAQLHKLAGTAAYFGEALLGEQALELEDQLRKNTDRDARLLLLRNEMEAMQATA